MLNLLTLLFFVGAPTAPQVVDTTPAIEWAIRLPSLVTEARTVGVAETVVREVLDGLRTRGLTAADAAMVLGEEVDAVTAGAPKDNFGAFVQQPLDAGLRGRALAQAIRMEHQSRGVGRRGGGKAPGRDTTKSGGGRP